MMFTLTKALEKALLQHFIYMKVDIAYAINKPFPFFEALRDKSFITERMYKESLEACLNLVPLSKVVHYILTSLEQSFHPSVLLTLFSKVNLREYPSLVAIFRSFRKVGYTYEEKNRPPLTLLEDLANPAEGCSLQTLLPPPRPQISLPSHLSSAPRVCDPRATAQPIIEILDEQPSPSPRAVPLLGCIQEGKTTPVSSRDHQRKDKEDSREMPHSPSGPESVVKDDSPAANDLAMAQEVPCTPANKKGAKPALKTMNSSSEHCNISDWLRLEATVKAFVYVVAFSITTSLTFVIIAIVSQSLQLRKEVRLVLLCHHLLCISSYCGLGVIFQGMLALLAKSPLLLCLLVFGAQLSVGEGILLTLTLMALNTYLAICYPLNSPSFVDSAKYRILAGTWTTVILKNVGLFLIEGTSPTPASVFQSAPLCPVILNGMPARVIGMFSLAFLLSVILVSYCLIYREGKRAGHFNKSNIKARRTVLVHLLQICLHVIPTLIIIGLGKQCGVFFFALNLALFGIFAFAQCFNPLVYGLHNRDLQSKLYPWLCCRKKLLP